ncbi:MULTISPECIES: septation ring formation regulator EzrA [unclassified Lactobacillus]|uniref:septation ring formation regulator EzrA n=1 Tax=unclassified Lactobacillus TaxID=2620435 RepID=UPI000EFCF4F8|nr:MULTISPECIES: septation ring formation regulator EzrA [unclassified Lactobacillus]RMC39835.1 septation ring formation regulator EzrA [Lactobacillus sp. ESL0237]RMC43994.1 septation ring formation regulator EzrA [Lactobacillus sp. ESL0234]RMC45324.1 septation ring formation regulator EzrA [Lactobacillus sp. ESL0236]RMC46283.1 septation ring formation regulator EzrA [Lactobacillus sp. ESL0230]RMC50587.1 septation ring formation regulator EzrA [Lactobacillus sp. ESL0225]
MSPTQSIVVIITILIIIIVIAFMLVVNRRQLHEIIELDDLIAKIDRMNLDADIVNLDKMDLAGESLTTFNTWRKSYEQTANKRIPQVQELLDQAAGQNTSYHLIRAHKNIKQAQAIMQSTFEDAKNTNDVFTELLESNRENQMQYEDLNKKYQEMRKQVLAGSFEYGSALDKLEDELTNVESDFAEAKSLTAQGDQVEAKRVLSKIRAAIISIDNVLPKIRADRRELDTIFQNQLKELTEVYKKMKASRFCINQVDVLAEIKKNYELVDNAGQLLTHLKIEELDQQIKSIKSNISDLYQLLENEYKARPFVEDNQDKIQRLLSHQQVEAKDLIQKLRHIDESYELTHNELEASRKLELEVNDMNRQYTVDTQNLADGKGVYSEIKASWLHILERLRVISSKQKAMAQDVDGLYDAENVAIDSINRYKQEVSLVYRRLERKELPGMPDTFVQMYTLVVNEIGHVAKELNQVRINMEKISNELINISDDVERLKREADDIVNSASLVELTMQYSNKYATNNAVRVAQKTALQLYSQEYNYKEALDTIATAIERVEPGSYQRLENLYYSEKTNS